MKEKYSLIVIPSEFQGKEFSDFKKKDAEKYLNWYKQTINERRKQFINLLQNIDTVWQPNFSKESLISPFRWFKTQIEMRDKTLQEMERDKMQLESSPYLKHIIPINPTTLNERTMSICFDIGAYFSRCIQESVSDLEWKYFLKPRKYIFYGQPVLASDSSKVKLEPLNLMEVQARKVLKGKTDENAFLKLFDIWVDNLKGEKGAQVQKPKDK